MEKDFDGWNNRKKEIERQVFFGFVAEREVWWCSLGINIGVEMNGKHQNYERPVLVIRKFSRDKVLVVPVSTKLLDD